MSQRSVGPGDSQPRESEATLVISSEDPKPVALRLEQLGEVNGYRLRPRPVEDITDVYVDTREGRLRATRTALRVRTLRGPEPRTLITLKSPSGPAGEYRQERTEIELPWSQEAARVILDQVSGAGVPPPVGPLPEHAEDFLKALGLEVIQRRSTRRKPIDVLAQPGDRVVAELAVDRVVYDLSGPSPELYEVEIEAKSPDGGKAVDRIVSALLESFGPSLRPWHHSKLGTGRAVEALMRGRGFSMPGPLRSADVDELARLLEQKSL